MENRKNGASNFRWDKMTVRTGIQAAGPAAWLNQCFKKNPNFYPCCKNGSQKCQSCLSECINASDGYDRDWCYVDLFGVNHCTIADAGSDQANRVFRCAIKNNCL